MATRIVCVDKNAHDHIPREIADTGQFAAFGEAVEIDDGALAELLLEQEEVWARPTTNAAKEAMAEAAKRAKAAAATDKADDTDKEPVE
jgi:hypothetical protein